MLSDILILLVSSKDHIAITISPFLTLSIFAPTSVEAIRLWSVSSKIDLLFVQCPVELILAKINCQTPFSPTVMDPATELEYDFQSKLTVPFSCTAIP